MSAEFGRTFELSLRQEDLVITPTTLWADNHSPIADQRRKEFEEARRKGELMGVLRCSDARVAIAGNSISVGTISAAGTPSVNLTRDRGLAAWITLSHFDGDTVDFGKMPEGCGGLKAKQQIGDAPRNNGIEKYVSEIIKHEDPVIQAILTAEAIAAISGKPVLAATQDHLDRTVYPIAYFQLVNGQMTSVSSVRNIDILKYNPESIYENGIPTIAESSLPDKFLSLLEQNRQEVQAIYANYPNIRSMQKVQKPRMVMFSTDIRSAKIKYPKLSSVPGSIFKTFVPRQKIDGGVHVPEVDLLNSLNQFEYPIDHARKNYGNPNEAFSNTDRILIETASMDESVRLAKTALEYDWMKNWINLPDRKIIAIQTVGGITSDIEELAA